VDQLMETLIGEMKSAGAEIVDPADIPTIGKFDESELTVLFYELKADLASYLARRAGSPVKSLKDVIEFNERNRGREMPYFGQDIFIKSEQKGPLNTKEYLDALALAHQPGQSRSRRRRQFERRRRRRLSQYQRNGRIPVGTAGRHFFLWTRLER